MNYPQVVLSYIKDYNHRHSTDAAQLQNEKLKMRQRLLEKLQEGLEEQGIDFQE